MAKIITTDMLEDLSPQHTFWGYNAMDASVTAEIREKTHVQLDNLTSKTYSFEKACLAPAMEMALRGIEVDLSERDRRVFILEDDARKLRDLLVEYGQALGYDEINANSPAQIKQVLYNDLNIPVQTKYDRKVKEEKVSTDREALEKVAASSLIGNPIVKAILARRDAVKKLSVLRSGIDADNRMRFSFNVGGTETGRWSSSKNAFGGGMNAQNITEELRPIFVARKGYKLAYIDKEQAESRAVAFLSGCPAYTHACNSGDLHTTVTKLIWPGLDWTGDPKLDRAIADRQFYRNLSYRDMSKKGGHGSNYLGTPRTMAMHLKVEEKLIKDFQDAYFGAFAIRPWHSAVAQELQLTGSLTTPFGRKRTFLGRLGDSSTLREAVAYVPQSLIADDLNSALLRLWAWNKVDLLAQIHDAILFEYPEDRDDLVGEAKAIMEQPIRLLDDTLFSIPCDAAVGFNWGKRTVDPKTGDIMNPDGLVKWKPGLDTRSRPASKPRPSLLDMRFPG